MPIISETDAWFKIILWKKVKAKKVLLQIIIIKQKVMSNFLRRTGTFDYPNSYQDKKLSSKELEYKDVMFKISINRRHM